MVSSVMPEKIASLPRSSLATDIALPVVLALATNGLIFALGWRQPDHDIQPGSAPPGYVIGIVWTVLFALMGAARYHATAKRMVTALIALCLAYPFYTLGLQDRMIGLAGIAVTGTLAIYIVLYQWQRARRAALLLLPLVAWLTFAAMLILSVERLNS